MRPFEKVKDNIIESINQTIFLALALPLIHLKNESKWENAYEDIYIIVLMISPITGSLVTLIDLFNEIFK